MALAAGRGGWPARRAGDAPAHGGGAGAAAARGARLGCRTRASIAAADPGCGCPARRTGGSCSAALREPDLRLDRRAGGGASCRPTTFGRAEALVALGRRRRGGGDLSARSRAGRARPRNLGRAAEQLAARRGGVPGGALLRATLTLATGLAILGRYDEARGALERAAARWPAAPTQRIRLAERTAWLLARAGDLAAARATLAEALARDGATRRRRRPSCAPGWRGCGVSAGRFDAALEVVAPALAAGGPQLAIEAALLARAYSGDLDGRAGVARVAAGPPRRRARTRQPTAAPGRWPTWRASSISSTESRSAAVTSYRRAFDRSAQIGDVHTLAAVALNLGALQADAGAYGEARHRHRARDPRARAHRRRPPSWARRCSTPPTCSFRWASSAPPAARWRARATRARGAEPPPSVEAFAVFVEGDLERREGQLARAAKLYRRRGGGAAPENGRAREAIGRAAGRRRDVGRGSRRLIAREARQALRERRPPRRDPQRRRRRRRRARARARAGAGWRRGAG